MTLASVPLAINIYGRLGSADYLLKDEDHSLVCARAGSLNGLGVRLVGFVPPLPHFVCVWIGRSVGYSIDLWL